MTRGMGGERTGKWAKRLKGERKSGRNDLGGETTRGERESGRNDSGANGKVGETIRIRSTISYKLND